MVVAAIARKFRTLFPSALLLLALLFRATVPVGFMPSGEGPLALKICPEGMPAAHHDRLLASHPHHGGSHGQFEHCPFGSVPGFAPHSDVLASVSPAPASPETGATLSSSRLAIRLERAHPARAPPVLLNC